MLPVAARITNHLVENHGPDIEYQLGHEVDELERLNVQGRALAAPTRALVEAAGLFPRMRAWGFA